MFVRALHISGFRNLSPLDLSPSPRFNVFAGDNGQGKTNLLEAVYVVCALRSFRTPRLAEVIQVGAERARVAARVARGGLERIYEVCIRERSRTARLDGKAVRPLSRYFGSFNVVLFAPEDLRIPRGSPSERRRFLDRAVFNRSAGYLSDAQGYDKVLRSRNAVLRDLADRGRGAAGDLLAVYDAQLAELGARLLARRLAFIAELAPRFAGSFEAITRTGAAAEISYAVPEALAGLAAEADLHSALADLVARSRSRDLARGTTSVGPHRDDLLFRLGGRPAHAFASQGQLRALMLAWKTAELDLLAAAHGEDPVFLLDDVSSELDAARNAYLFEFIRRRANQCFITTTHPRHVLLAAERADYEVRSGCVRRQNER